MTRIDEVGAPTHDYSRWALLLIDVQRDFWTPAHQRTFPLFPDNVGNLLTFCRREGLEVIHVRSRFRTDRSDWMPTYRLRQSIPCLEGAAGAEVLPGAREEPGELVLLKQTFDAFHLPELAAHLTDGGRRIVVTAGLETSYCVFLSTASACQHGFLPLMLEDCCADDPELDPRATADLLDRYEGKAFWRLPWRRLKEAYPDWMSRLERIGATRDGATRDGAGRC